MDSSQIYLKFTLLMGNGLVFPTVQLEYGQQSYSELENSVYEMV